MPREHRTPPNPRGLLRPPGHLMGWASPGEIQRLGPIPPRDEPTRSPRHGGTHTSGSRAMNAQTLAHNPRSNSRTMAAGTTTNSANGAPATTGTASNSRYPNAYTYGTGNGARHYRAYGYGNGYRNRSYGGGYGYGRSQGNNRAVVARLRSVHASLAQDRSRLPRAPRPRDAGDLDGDPPALAPIDGAIAAWGFRRE